MEGHMLRKKRATNRATEWKPRSRRYKFKVLEILIDKGAVTKEELAELLMLGMSAVNKVTRSLALSGLIVRMETDGQLLAITNTGARVWKGADLEKQKRMERELGHLNLQQQGASGSINAG